jgi:SAM-dependent methyltransferase
MNPYSKILNYEDYTQRMTKAIYDKLFFIDKIETKLIVDFGCADGRLLQTINSVLQDPEVRYIGYDIDEKMIELANQLNESPNISFTSNWDEVETKGGTLILSSIIHEVYHYLTVMEISKFWHKVFLSDFKYIVLRDMIPSSSIDRESEINDVTKIYRKHYPSKQFKDFQNIWGSIENNKQLIHFLLKYKYLEPNWDREVKENYFPIYKEDLLAIIPSNYDILYSEHLVLPFLKENIFQDFKIELKDKTHLKLILKRTDI